MEPHFVSDKSEKGYSDHKKMLSIPVGIQNSLYKPKDLLEGTSNIQSYTTSNKISVSKNTRDRSKKPALKKGDGNESIDIENPAPYNTYESDNSFHAQLRLHFAIGLKSKET